MTKHTPQVFSGRQLANHIFDHEQLDGHDWSMVLDADGEPIESAYDQFFVVQWPDHCVTCQHLGDATIHGPYDSENEAMSIHEGSEIY